MPLGADRKTMSGTPICDQRSSCRLTSCASRGRVREEDVAARLQDRLGTRLQPLCDVLVEHRRLAREHAIDTRAPLLPDAAGLDARGLRGDARPLVDDDARSPFGKLEGDGEPGDAGPDDCDLHAGSLAS